MNKKPLPRIPKVLFYKNLVTKTWYGHICLEYNPSYGIGAHIALPHRLSCFDSSGADFEMGIYLNCFAISFHVEISWNEKPKGV